MSMELSTFNKTALSIPLSLTAEISPLQGYLEGGGIPPKNLKFPPTLKNAKFLEGSISTQIRFVNF